MFFKKKKDLIIYSHILIFFELFGIVLALWMNNMLYDFSIKYFIFDNSNMLKFYLNVFFSYLGLKLEFSMKLTLIFIVFRCN